jgi:hypothetical protein
VVAVLWGYFDESGESGPTGALKRLTLGGFFAPWSSIETLCAEWRAALDGESLAEFHMKDIASDENLYSIWPPERQRRLDRFVDILCGRGAYFCAFSYSTETIDEDKLFRDTYEAGLARVLITASSLCDKTSERGRLVFAQTHEIRGELIRRYVDRLGWDEYLDSWEIQRSRDNPALQAAEVMVRGMKRLMQDGIVTHSFARVCATGKPIRFWPEDPFAAKGMPATSVPSDGVKGAR